MLICPVRGCGLELRKDERRAFCARGHSFDVARSGYLNLLQPQDRRSREPGDTAAALAARRRIHDRGVSAPMLRAAAEMLSATRSDSVLEAGCGDGLYLGTLAEQFGFDGHGVDISAAAVDAAARRYPQCAWVVANADRSLPYSAGSFSIVLSITARMNAPEFRRVLRKDGRLLVGVPAPDDLTELRGAGRDRVARTIETFQGFALVEQRRATHTVELNAAGVEDVRHAIYRPMRAKPAEAGRVTFSLDLLLFRVS